MLVILRLKINNKLEQLRFEILIFSFVHLGVSYGQQLSRGL
jgi:hypothetical protein